MAQSIQLKSGSMLVGSPIEYVVTADTVGDNCTFHRVNLTVTAVLTLGGSTLTSSQSYTLARTAENGEQVTFDVSDVLRVVAGQYDFAALPSGSSSKTYPLVHYSLTAVDEYLLNGVLHTGATATYDSRGALFGYFTDYERYFSAGTKDIARFSRKPTTGEVADDTYVWVYPKALSSAIQVDTKPSEGGSVIVRSMAGCAGTFTNESGSVYIDPNARDRINFQFVNGMGVVESIQAECRTQATLNGTTEQDTVTTQPTAFGSPSRLSVRQADRRTKLKCSTGVLPSKEWLQWWMDEFLGGDPFRRGLTTTHWVLFEGQWVPCVCYPDDEVTLYDRSKTDPLQVEFICELALNGAIPIK